MSASLSLEILKGGPLDGLPAFFLRFEKEGDVHTKALGDVLLSTFPLPLHLRIVWVEGDAKGIQAIFDWCASVGISTSVEIFGSFEPWMVSAGRRILHTSDDLVPHPVEEVIFHTEAPPSPRFFPYHALSHPMMWWAPTSKNISLSDIPLGMRLFLPRRVPQEKLFPKGEA